MYPQGKVQYVGTTESEEYAPGPSSCKCVPQPAQHISCFNASNTHTSNKHVHQVQSIVVFLLLCSYAVGVYNRETGVLEVMPVAGGRLLRMEPRLPGLSYKPTLTGAEDDGEQTREERLAQNKK